jgi:hypothetical protein
MCNSKVGGSVADCIAFKRLKLTFVVFLFVIEGHSVSSENDVALILE